MRNYDLKEEIYPLQQGAPSITLYYTNLKNNYGKNKKTFISSLFVPAMSSVHVLYSQRSRIIVKRAMLIVSSKPSTSNTPLSSQIKFMTPLPHVNKVFSMLMQQQCKNSTLLDEGKHVGNVTHKGAPKSVGIDIIGRGPHTGHGKGLKVSTTSRSKVTPLKYVSRNMISHHISRRPMSTIALMIQMTMLNILFLNKLRILSMKLRTLCSSIIKRNPC